MTLGLRYKLSKVVGRIYHPLRQNDPIPISDECERYPVDSEPRAQRLFRDKGREVS